MVSPGLHLSHSVTATPLAGSSKNRESAICRCGSKRALGTHGSGIFC